MNLKDSVSLYAGGAGSGCKGSNCGRPRKTVEKVSGLRNSAEIEKTLLERSGKGGAWVAVVPAFSKPGDPVELHGFRSPSAVPDYYLDLSNRERGIAWKGKFVPYPKSTVLRDQRRAYSGDR